MMNQVVLVGRITNNIETIKDDMGRSTSCITIAVTRPFKNENGEYETDLITCTLWNGIAENAAEYCKKGDVVGIKGRLQNEDQKTIVMVERLTFLSSKNNEDENGKEKE